MAVKMTAVRGAYPNREVGVGGRTYRTDDDGVVLVEVQHLPEMLRRGFSRTTIPEVFYDAPREPRPEILSLPVDRSVITEPHAGDDPIHEYEPTPSEVLTEPISEEVLEPRPSVEIVSVVIDQHPNSRMTLTSKDPRVTVRLVDKASVARKPTAKPRGRPRKAVVG